MARGFLFCVVAVLAFACFGLTASAQELCTDNCPSSGDGECDDGGPGSLYDICDLGSDCTDCGVRAVIVDEAPPYEDPPFGGVCTDTCPSSNDGECDDGGPGSLYDICELGSDCSDCGVR